ncbi:MAG TPA: DUF4252 domain-containing protein [Acidobacteriaceae bacterium]|jgi:hypothetical protein
MTMTMKTLQAAMLLAVTGGSMAMAQEVVMVPSVKVNPVADVAGVDLHINGLNLQTNVAVSVAYQAKDDIFAGAQKFAQGASEVTEINLDPSTMGLVGMNHGKEGEEARKMKSMVIHTYKYDKPGMYRMDDVDAYRKKIEGGSWQCAIHVRNTAGSTDICSRTSADQTNEMVILTAEPQKLTFIHISGKMSLDELNDMSGSASSFRPRGVPKLPRDSRESRESRESRDTRDMKDPKEPKDPKPKGKITPPVPPAPAVSPTPPSPPGAI